MGKGVHTKWRVYTHTHTPTKKHYRPTKEDEGMTRVIRSSKHTTLHCRKCGMCRNMSSRIKSDRYSQRGFEGWPYGRFFEGTRGENVHWLASPSRHNSSSDANHACCTFVCASTRPSASMSLHCRCLPTHSPSIRQPRAW